MGEGGRKGVSWPSVSSSDLLSATTGTESISNTPPPRHHTAFNPNVCLPKIATSLFVEFIFYSACLGEERSAVVLWGIPISLLVRREAVFLLEARVLILSVKARLLLDLYHGTFLLWLLVITHLQWWLYITFAVIKAAQPSVFYVAQHHGCKIGASQATSCGLLIFKLKRWSSATWECHIGCTEDPVVCFMLCYLGCKWCIFLSL